MSNVIVLGAGMAGVSIALQLRKRGWSVVLVDRTEPGLETSYGNAGIIQSEAVEPYAMPRDIATTISWRTKSSCLVSRALSDSSQRGPITASR